MSMINRLIGTALMYSSMFQVDSEEWKDRIIKRWDESRNFPRKKKKLVRKSLQLEWDIARYNPLDF